MALGALGRGVLVNGVAGRCATPAATSNGKHRLHGDRDERHAALDGDADAPRAPPHPSPRECRSCCPRPSSCASWSCPRPCRPPRPRAVPRDRQALVTCAHPHGPPATRLRPPLRRSDGQSPPRRRCRAFALGFRASGLDREEIPVCPLGIARPTRPYPPPAAGFEPSIALEAAVGREPRRSARFCCRGGTLRRKARKSAGCRNFFRSGFPRGHHVSCARI